MSALNENPDTAKLRYFRYSLDEIPQQAISKSVLKRKNTIPQSSSSTSSKNQSNNLMVSTDKSIIKKLQKMGAHSYVGNMEAVGQTTNRSQNANNFNYTEIFYEITDSTNFSNFRNSVLVNNDQYMPINENINENNTKEGRLCTADHIYEWIPSKSSISTIITKKDTNAISNNNVILRSETYDINSAENRNRPTTYLLENEIYEGIKLNPSKNNAENNIRLSSFIIEDNNYYIVNEGIESSNIDSEIVFAEQKCCEVTDVNANNLTLNNKRGEENIYSIVKQCDSEKISIDSVRHRRSGTYVEDQCHTEDDKSNELKLEKTKNKTQFKEHINKHKKDEKSFIKRVWRKNKKTRKEKEESVEEVYETIPNSHDNKVELADETAVQMLSELQRILENKKPLIIETSTKRRPISDLKQDINESDITTDKSCSSTSGKRNRLPYKYHDGDMFYYNDNLKSNRSPFPPQKKQITSNVKNLPDNDRVLDDPEDYKLEKINKYIFDKTVKELKGLVIKSDVDLKKNNASDLS